MPSTVISSGNDIVRMSNELNVAEDGFVTLRASYYVPAQKIGVARADFALYQPFRLYPSDQPIAMVPPLQEGLTVSAVASRMDRGLCYYDVTFVSALTPPKIAVTESVQRLSFNGYYEDPEEGSGSLSFDYYTKSVTHRTTIVRSRTILLEPKGEIVFAGINRVANGIWRKVIFTPTETLSANQEIVGNVARMEVTSTIVFADTTEASGIWPGLPLPNGGLSNPWESDASGKRKPPQ